MKKKTKIIIIILAIAIVLMLAFLLYFKLSFISKGEVRTAIVENMQVEESALHFESIDFELDNKTYEVEVYYQNKEYEFIIDAKDGDVIYTDYRSSANESGSNSNSNQSTTSKEETTHDIGLDKAKEIALENASVKESDVSLVKQEQDYDDGRKYYEIEFIYQEMKYDYKISAATGEITEFERDSIYD